MAALMPGLPSQRGVGIRPEEEEEEVEIQSRKWYFSRQEIEELSPSRKDGVDLETESRLRKLYCSFIKEIGMKLKVPQVAIACAMMLCHRFYMRQSHAKNDWQTIATVSVFLACKLEETPRSLTDVVVKAYELTYKWDPSAPERIRKVEFANKQKELIVIGERLLLATLAFDLDIQLPYKPLVDALRKLGLFQLLGQVAWNFVNDWLCTTLCLQYKPHYTAAGALFLAAKFKKVKLPKEKGKVWWLEFDVSPKQLEEVIQYMLRLLEEEKIGKLPQNHDKAIQSRALVGKQIVNSPQSTITSVSTSNSHSSNGAEIESLASSERNLGVKEVSQCQMSDSSASSIVEDGDGESQPKAGESDCRIVPIPPSYHNVDTEKIGEALKTGRCQGFTNEKSTEAMTSKMDSEAFIERELENGIVLESASTKSKQRDANAGTVIESMGSDERTVGVVVLHHLPSSMSIISIVGDGDKDTLPRTEDLELGSTCQIVSVHSSHLKIDSSKIREKLKRRRGELAASKVCNEPTNIDINSEAWIERELEDGIELEFSSSGKKQKLV